MLCPKLNSGSLATEVRHCPSEASEQMMKDHVMTAMMNDQEKVVWLQRKQRSEMPAHVSALQEDQTQTRQLTTTQSEHANDASESVSENQKQNIPSVKLRVSTSSRTGCQLLQRIVQHDDIPQLRMVLEKKFDDNITWKSKHLQMRQGTLLTRQSHFHRFSSSRRSARRSPCWIAPFSSPLTSFGASSFFGWPQP